MDLAIETKALSKSFDGLPAVDKLYLAVPAGSIFGLIGPNGAGKSTLIQMLTGIIRPDSGDGFILGQSIRIRDGSIRNRVGYIPDVPLMYPGFTVAEMYRLGSKLYPFWDWERCRELHQGFHLSEGKHIRNLSRGQKVQVALVMALALRPQLLLLDEPTAGLDPVVRRAFLQTIIEEVADQGTTVFYSSHNLNDLEQSADHIATIYRGRILFSHTLDELKELVHRLQIIFTGEPPEDVIKSLPGLVEYQQSGRVITITITGHLDSISPRLVELEPELVKELNLDLESIFVAFMKAQGYGFER
ncbi:MAG: ABC transporter ATP-binding protein [Syntrophomonadaceae bacterium]|nr:ABC transporter ATP-binding protein [Syntrophomonadaceae bacterium]